MKSLWKLAVVATATALLVACGGGGGGGNDTPINVAGAAAPVTVNATTGGSAVQAMTAAAIVFANGVPDFGTTASTTLSVTASPSGTPAPSFNVSDGTSTAAGDLTFGSCIFTVKTSNFPAGSKLATGAKITISPCTLNLATAGTPATGVATSINVTLTLNTVTSAPYKEVVVISPSGTVTVNGTTVVTVKASPATGG